MSKLTPKDKNAIRGGIRRAFSRSELRQQALNTAIVHNVDPTRPKVKNWVRCASCKKLEAKSYVQVDHKLPVVPVHLTGDSMTWDAYVAALWCDVSNLQVLCTGCHKLKSKAENQLRRKNKK